jgi:hypothetical protein
MGAIERIEIGKGAQFDIFWRDFDRLVKDYERGTILKALAQKIAVTAQAQVSDPPEPSRAPLEAIYERERIRGGEPTGETYYSKFKSREQQGYVFGVVIENDLTPYVRGRNTSEQLTAQLGALPFDITMSDNAAIITIGTDVTYAQLVVGRTDQQSFYHRANWTPLEDDIYSPRALEEYDRVLLIELKSIIEQLLNLGRSTG